MVLRVAVRLSVTYVRVFRIQLSLVRLMDQKIEAMGIRIVLRDRHEMLFIECNHLAHSLGKPIQKAPALFAKNKASLGRYLLFFAILTHGWSTSATIISTPASKKGRERTCGPERLH
jgi:hypothetical protein